MMMMLQMIMMMDDTVVYDPDGHDHDDARVKGMQLIR